MRTETTSTLDVGRARAQFPALNRQVGDHPARFLDGAGGSQVPETVIEAMAHYLRHSNANAGGAFATSAETDRVLSEAHAAAADLLGAEPEEIVAGANMTTLNFLLSRALGRTLAAEDEIIVTELDHEANVSPWRLLAADRDLVLHTVGMNSADGTLRVEELEARLGPRTRVVAFPLASNALGTVPDARRIVAAAHEAGALAWADGVHAAPHRSLHFAELGLDVLLCSPYKYFGPHLGVAAVRRELAETWPADRVAPAAETPPGHRFETGTLSHEALAALPAAVDYLAGLAGSRGARRERLLAAYAAVERHERELSLRFLAGAESVPGLRIFGITDPERVGERTPTFLIRLGDWEVAGLARALGERGFFAWHGDFYAPGAVRGVGLDPNGGVRISFVHYNTVEEVDDLIAGLRELA